MFVDKAIRHPIAKEMMIVCPAHKRYIEHIQKDKQTEHPKGLPNCLYWYILFG